MFQVYRLLEQDALEPGKDLPDGVDIRAVGRDIKQSGACLFDGFAHTWHLVDGQVVHDDDIAFFQRGAEDFFDANDKNVPFREGPWIQIPRSRPRRSAGFR